MPAFAAATVDQLWQKGNGFYQEKQYDSAVWYYQQIAVQKPQNEEVYFNLGNAFYRLNKIGPAVLNYERALHINPEYKAAKDNLALTQSRIGNKILPAHDIFFVVWWHKLTSAQNNALWAVVCLVLFLIAVAVMLYNRLRKTEKGIPRQFTGILFAIWVICLILAFQSAHNIVEPSKGVVMQNEAPMLYQLNGKKQSLVPEGTTVEIADKKDGWVQIVLPDGRNGWMQQTLIAKI